MNIPFLAISIILIVLGIIGLALDFYAFLMWIVIIFGVLGTIWGMLIQTPRGRFWGT